jgi:hypothetical protein
MNAATARAKRGPKFKSKGLAKEEQQRILASLHQTLDGMPHGSLAKRLRELQPVYPWLTRDMFKHYRKVKKQKELSVASFHSGNPSASSSTASTASTSTNTACTASTTSINTSASSADTPSASRTSNDASTASSTNNDERHHQAREPLVFKPPGRPKGSTIAAKKALERRKAKVVDDIASQYHAVKEVVVEGRRRTQKGTLSAIIERTITESGRDGMKVSHATIKSRIRRGNLVDIQRGATTPLASIEPAIAKLVAESNLCRNPLDRKIQ